MIPLINRIGQYINIDSNAFEDIEGIAHRIETRQSGQDIVTIDETVDFVFFIETGWAIRYRILDDGRRQIINFMLPGDCFDLMSLNRAKSDHSVAAASEVVLRRVKSDDFLKTVARKPQLATAFWWAAIQEEAILREQIIRIGRRTAKERLGHLILELYRRQAAASGVYDNYLALPIPQALFADALGLSIVHVSRTLTLLRKDGLLRVTNRGIEILDRDRLTLVCDFDSRYLKVKKLSI